MQSSPEAPPSAARKLSLYRRARSVPYKRPYILALLLSALFYLALIGTVAALFAFMVEPTKNSASLLIGFGGFSATLWFFSFLKRRACHCPLCKGTPFVDNSAHHHEKAVRFFPLNYGSSNVIRALARQHFRCHYCGTPFDLLKPFTRHYPGQEKEPVPFNPPGPAGIPPAPPTSPLSPPAA